MRPERFCEEPTRSASGARKAAIAGVQVGGKTGTAQVGARNEKNPYTWFIGYAQLDDGSSPVTVAVMVEDTTDGREDVSGGGVAATVARK